MTTAPFHLQTKIKSLWVLVGNTPLLAIDFLYKGEKRTIFAKQEHFNITGSIKDRMALSILERAYEKGAIKPGDKIVEATSGNTGIAFAAIGRALGHPVVILMPDWMSQERVDIIRSLGAEVIPVSKEQGGFLGSIALTEKIKAEEPDVFLPSQFSNEDNVNAHFRTTGPEIWQQLQSIQVMPDAFIAGVGTGGTIMGVGQYLRSQNPAIKIHPLEPAESPTMRTGHKVGKHRIQGVSDEFIPSIVKFDHLDRIVDVHDGDGILMAQKLAAELGLAVGISSGANFAGAIQVQNELGPQSHVVTVFCDSNKKYLSTDLLKTEPVHDDYLSPHVEFTGIRTLRRVCAFCPAEPVGF
ncbi:MAG: cysteine synthase family protein [Saprospirales bacterium]|nr:cysteine synthase family protein [Saprospirales bacterium]